MADYVELHARSSFSFLRGASGPEDLIKAAKEQHLSAMALLDRDGVYGAPRFYQCARQNEFRARVGAEITLEDGTVLPLLVENRTGYQNLCRLITTTKLTPRLMAPGVLAGDPPPDPQARKRPCFATWAEIAEHAEGLIALTGDEEGPIRHAWRTQGAQAVAGVMEKLRQVFGDDRLYVEIQRRRLRGEERENAFLVDLARATGVPLLATGGVNYAMGAHRETADVFTCLRWHTTLDEAGRRLEINAERQVKSAQTMHELFRDLPEALTASVRLENRLEFTLQKLGYTFPEFPTPGGVPMDQYLHEITLEAARQRLVGKSSHEAYVKCLTTIDRELALISKLGFSGYFLIVWDICRWAREQGILVQGRGSAANSAVCYVLGITAVNPLKHRLLFDRFLSEGRVGADGNPSWPDIDLDFPSGDRREKVIQEVYRRYGRLGAAMTANVICYRGRSSVREIGKVLGFGEDALDRFSGLYANGDFPETLGLQKQLSMAGVNSRHPRASALARLCEQIEGMPRHLGQHSGGMVICQGSLGQVVPLENASMPDRTVCQWDKEDCENLGIVKIDFLGLGMMAVIQDSLELVAKKGGPRDLHEIPEDDAETYEKIRAADTIGVFQIESRAQMATLPRFKPKNLYDLAMQVAIVRPGPITGKLVHPLIRRRDELEKDDYIDPSVEDDVREILQRTRGVILFQEQMLELSITLAGYTGGEAEGLRRAMGFTKDPKRLDAALEKLSQAMREKGRNEVVVQKVTQSAKSFAAYGFPESHAIGFAMLAYASTWMKVHHPAAFYASLLNNQPMGFYSPATLLQDGKRHDLVVLPVSVLESEWNCSVVEDKTIRIGLRFVKGLKEANAQVLLQERAKRPFTSMDDFLRRTSFSAAERRSLASVGALNTWASHRRAALWEVEAGWSEEESLFHQFAVAEPGQSPLVPMTLSERLQTDFSELGVTTGKHPMALLRDRLPGVCRAADLKEQKNGTWVTIAGSVICRQRPGTASGFVFISLEDETGIANAVVVPALFERQRMLITQESALKISGRLQIVGKVIHLRAQRIQALSDPDLPEQTSHDFH
ncbi:MAG TPA: error-prone DNA polymerase [Opitutaceae bacterium]|nr:error-prone DNA polymerase [Opitutaceae bacterium]